MSKGNHITQGDPPRFQDLRILIVDDSRSMRRIIRSYLENNRATRIAEAGNGRAAMDLVKFQPLDLIISDLNMPVMNGMELLETVKADPVFQKICFIMLTVEAIQKTMNQALGLGADSYIVKPVTEIVFIREIKAALAGGDIRRE